MTDPNDTFLAADYSHPGDNIPPVLAVAQHCGRTGMDLVRGLAAAYEIHVALVKGICLHAHKIDHIAHLGPSAAAGIGAALGLGTATVYQAVQQALHVTTTTRQSRNASAGVAAMLSTNHPSSTVPVTVAMVESGKIALRTACPRASLPISSCVSVAARILRSAQLTITSTAPSTAAGSGTAAH